MCDLLSLPIQFAQFACSDALPCMLSKVHYNHTIIESHALKTMRTTSYTHIFFKCARAWFAYASTLSSLHSAVAYNDGVQKFAAALGGQVCVLPGMQLAAREAAVQKIWDSAVVDSINSLINFSLYSDETDGQAGVSAQWHAQGNNTQTHSNLVMLWAQLSACIVLQHIGPACDRLCSYAAKASAQAFAQHRLRDDADSKKMLKVIFRCKHNIAC